MADRDNPGASGVELDTSGLAPARSADDDAVERSETFLDAHDAERLFCQSWTPADGDPERGMVALLHGYGEHSSRYSHVATALVRAGFGVTAIDARGAGRSTGKRAHVDSFDDYVRDYRTLIEYAAERWPALPRFGLGHSNGGLVVLRYALHYDRSESGLDGLIVTSPFLGFEIEVPGHKSAAAKLLSRVWPSFSLPSEVDPSKLSHDTHVVDTYRNDPLVQRIATVGWFNEVLAAQRDLLERADTIEHPSLFLIAGADEIADPEVASDVFHELGAADREMEVFPSLYHEILNEPEWGQITEQMVAWMIRHLGPEKREEAA